MHTGTYSEAAFLLADLGLASANFCLNSGNNTIDLSPVGGPTIFFTIPDFAVPGGSVRLNQLCKANAYLAWRAAEGGSILLTLEFESAGTELLGTYHGQINDGKLRIYLATHVDHCLGQLVVNPRASFSAKINIIGLADEIERALGIRDRIRREVAEATRLALASSGPDLAELVFTNLSEANQPIPPAGAFYYQVAITEGHATLSWAESVRYADITIESVEPNLAESDQRLVLRLNAGGASDCNLTASRSAGPDKQLTLPLKLSHVPLPDVNPLHLQISMDAIDLSGPTPKGRTVGRIGRIFANPGYGAGVHTDSDGGLTVTYRLTVT